MNIQAVFFDLDGTLLNTLDDIAAATNLTLSNWGYPEHKLDAFKLFVGSGGDNLMIKALPEGEKERLGDKFESLIFEMRKTYFENSTVLSKPYSGIMNLLSELQNKNIIMAIITNKPHLAALKVTEHYFSHIDFKAVFGARKEFPLKPDPTVLLDLAKKLNLKPQQIAYLGDSDVDIHTAKNAKVTSLGAAWGFRGKDELIANGADFVLEHPEELIKALKI